MPVNQRKIISIILAQCNEIEERCDGYREELLEVVADILSYERSHMVAATTIQKNVNRKCNAAAHFLAARRERHTDVDGTSP